MLKLGETGERGRAAWLAAPGVRPDPTQNLPAVSEDEEGIPQGASSAVQIKAGTLGWGRSQDITEKHIPGLISRQKYM